MGLLRFWLAFSVLCGHVGPIGHYFPINGELAVECFYMVSGFYMALILDQKYGKSTWIFYFNRIIRLYPVYLALLALAVLFSWWQEAGPWQTLRQYWPVFGVWSRAFAVGTNLLIEGKDLSLFVAVDPRSAQFHLIPDAVHSALNANAFIYLPQSWSLGLEFNFYLLSPWLVRLRSRWIVALILLSVALRIGLAVAGYVGDPWTYRFFPTEIGVFLLGLLSYRLYRHGSVQGGAWTVVGRHAAAMLIPMVALSQWIPWDRGTATLLTLAVLSLALPYLFTRTKDSAFDRFLGEFSYGIYLGHILVDNFLHTFGFLNGDGPWNSVVVLGVVMGLVWLIRRFTEIPSDRWRHRLTERWLNTLAS